MSRILSISGTGTYIIDYWIYIIIWKKSVRCILKKRHILQKSSDIFRCIADASSNNQNHISNCFDLRSLRWTLRFPRQARFSPLICWQVLSRRFFHSCWLLLADTARSPVRTSSMIAVTSISTRSTCLTARLLQAMSQRNRHFYMHFFSF